MPMPRRVVLINDTAFVNGGQAKVAIESALGLASRGLDVHFYAGVGPADDRLAAAGIQVHGLESHDILTDPNRARAILHGVWNRPAAQSLKQVLSAFDRADTLVHIHGWAKSLSGAIAPVVRASGLPHVFTMHEFALACPNSAFLDHQKVEICTRKPLGLDCLTTNCDSRSYPHKAWRIMRQLGLKAGGWPQKLDHLIYLSQTELTAMKPHLPDTAKLWSVTNPVEANPAPPTNAGDNDVFLFLGRLSAEKGPVLFAQAAARLGVRAVFVGSGELEDDIRAAYPQAELTGWVNADEVQDWINKARAHVFPSLWYETHGLVAYEAQARGVPVIVGDKCAAAEAIIDGQTGLTFDMGSLDSLTEAMAQLMDKEKAARMGQAAYQNYWQNPLTLDRHLDELSVVYEAAMQPA